mgnify:FL=1|jgi:hypothetical protein
MKRVVATTCFIWLMCLSLAARADDVADATRAAQQIGTSIAENRLNTLWEAQVSKWLKDRISKDVFLANLSQGRASVGGARLSSQVVDVSYANKDVQTGYAGDIYYCRFLTKYPAGSFYETIVLIKEQDGEFRLSGAFAAPAPTQ